MLSDHYIRSCSLTVMHGSIDLFHFHGLKSSTVASPTFNRRWDFGSNITLNSFRHFLASYFMIKSLLDI